MVRKAQVEITVKAARLTAKEKERLRKALSTVFSIMDQHDLTKVTLEGKLTRQGFSQKRK
jgi:hypothetical protein